MKTKSPVEISFDAILGSSIFRLNGPKIDICSAIIELCENIASEKETKWSIGEFGECSLDSLIVGAYWALTEWHAGQSSQEYQAMCALGSIFSPGHSRAPSEDDDHGAWTAYKLICDNFDALNKAKE